MIYNIYLCICVEFRNSFSYFIKKKPTKHEPFRLCRRFWQANAMRFRCLQIERIQKRIFLYFFFCFGRNDELLFDGPFFRKQFKLWKNMLLFTDPNKEI